MMVETILESSQDFGMSNGVLPQWKRELLQRRAARARPPVPPPAPPPAPAPPPPPDDDEELRYGPGIVKRLKSRYLSLALREAPRRRPSVLRRAASLEHLLDERPPPAPPSARPHARPARPVSLAAPMHALAAQPTRRESVKRARSVDALSRLDRDEPPPVPLVPPPVPLVPPPLPPPPPPPLPRAVRPPRRVTPLLRETERPPADVVRSTLRKFESAPPRRTAPAARVSAVLRGLENAPRSSTPEPRGRSPSPAAADLSAIDEPEGAACSSPCEAKQVSRAALEGIARAGSSVRYSFPAPRVASHLPPLSATNPVLLGRARASASPRRVGVIRPMPAQRDRTVPSPTLTPTPTPVPDDVDVVDEKLEDVPSVASPPPFAAETPTKKDSPPSAIVEPLPRTPPEERPPVLAQLGPATPPTTREATPEPEAKPRPPVAQFETPKIAAKPAINGHATPPKPAETKPRGAFSKIGAAGIERAWTGAEERKSPVVVKERSENGDASPVPAWARGAGVRAARSASGGATSVVFNFSARKDVPDYIENDGIILRASRRNRFKAGESGIVVLRPEALVPDSDSEEEDARPPSPCSVRFVNDNVLINGRSSMAARITIAKDRAARLKLQFDDSLTRTFEYPSETSLCEESPSAPCPSPALAAPAAPAPSNGELQLSQSTMMAPLAANTHLASASLSRYTPSKTLADSFALGMARPATCSPHESEQPDGSITENGDSRGAVELEPAAEPEAELGDARPCAAESARSWSEARTHATDLLF
ncbi:proline-rich protein 36-like [Maniola hyperantus]|uniref:proline-rich protein 36-like n=1 Tax=Aphantopus hyperantus TaxID=2795564 RepID=UPI0021323956